MTLYASGPRPPDAGGEDPTGATSPAVGLLAPQEGLHQILGPRNFPAPELMPPSIVRRRAVGAAKRRVLLAAIGLVGLMLLLFGFARMQLSQAQNQLAVAQQSLREAEAAKAEYDDVPTVYAAVDAARAELAGHGQRGAGRQDHLGPGGHPSAGCLAEHGLFGSGG